MAIMVEEGTTNLVPNPLAKDNLTGIGYYFGGGSAGIIERSTSLPSGCPWLTGVKVTITTAGIDANVIFKQTDGSEPATGIPVTAGATYTYSIWLYIPSDSGITQLRLRPIEWNSSVVKDSVLVSFNTKGVWQRVVATWTLQSTTAKVTLRVMGYGTGVFYATACMLEQKPYATSFIDGTRAAESLTIPTAGVLNKDEGTIELWINPIVVQNYNNFFSMTISTGRFLLFFSSDGVVRWDYGPANSGLTTGMGVAVAGQWLHIAMRWSASSGSRELFVNGQYIGTRSFTPPDSLPTSVSIVNNYGALIDDLRISSRARTDEEIATAYASGEPMPVDKWTTWKSSFDGHLHNEVPVRKYGLMLKHGTIKLEAPSPDEGIQIYDASGNLRTHIGQYAPEKYGLKIIGGEIYSTSIQTGQEGDAMYIALEPPNKLVVYSPKTIGSPIPAKMFEMSAHRFAERAGMTWYDANGHYYGALTGEVTNSSMTLSSPYGTLNLVGQFGVAISGDTHVSGDLTKTGTLNYVEPTKDYGIRLLNALEGPELKYVDMGRAQLENGEATVYLDPILLQCIEPDTDLTPWLFKTEVYGEGEDIRVIEWGENYFKVKECNGGTSNRKFGWWFYATRINYAGIRLQEYVAGVV